MYKNKEMMWNHQMLSVLQVYIVYYIKNNNNNGWWQFVYKTLNRYGDDRDLK